MHGFIEFPAFGCWMFLLLALAIGVGNGLAPRAETPVLSWLGISLGYSCGVVLIVMLYSEADFLSIYWLYLFVPVFAIVLLLIGIAWLISRRFRAVRQYHR